MSRWLERVFGTGPRPVLCIDDTSVQDPVDWHGLLQPRVAALAPRQDVDVVVADAWCRFWLTAPALHTRDLAALRAAASARAQALYELNPADWAIEADWRLDRPFLCCALPQDLLAAVRTLAESRPVRLRRVQPQALQAWRQAGLAEAPMQWLCHVSPRTVLSLVLQHGRLQHVRHSWFGTPGDSTELPGLLREQAAQLGLPAPAQVLRLDRAPACA